MSSQGADNEYSRAFQEFVQGEDDLLGLLAYALYKKGIHEARVAGRPAPEPGRRNPSEAEKRAFRSLAKDMLDVFGESAQASAKESILDGGIRPDLISLRTELVAHIDRKTSWRSAFFVNLAAWIASIGLTLLLAVAVSAPNWVGQVRRALGLD